MRDEDFVTEMEDVEEEYDMDEKEFEELDPFDQGILMEWKRAGRYNKKEETIDDFEED